MKQTTPLLQLRGVTKRYGFVHALKSVDVTLYPGEIVAVVGDNGAGKSTLANVMTDMTQPDEGEILWQGKPVTISSVAAATNLGIAAVFQGQEFCENLDVAANLFLGKEVSGRGGVRNDNAMTVLARKALNSLTSAIRTSQSISSLSGGQRQTVAIARTLLNDPQLIVMDEPTAALSVIQTAEVLSYIEKLRAEGRTVVMISHSLPDVFAIANRIAVLRKGRLIGLHNTADTSYEHIIAEIAGATSLADESSAASNRSDVNGDEAADAHQRTAASVANAAAQEASAISEDTANTLTHIKRHFPAERTPISRDHMTQPHAQRGHDAVREYDRNHNLL